MNINNELLKINMNDNDIPFLTKLKELETLIDEFEKYSKAQINVLKYNALNINDKQISELKNNTNNINNKFKECENFMMEQNTLLTPTEFRILHNTFYKLKNRYVNIYTKLNDEYNNNKSNIKKLVNYQKLNLINENYNNILNDNKDLLYLDVKLQQTENDNSHIESLIAKEKLKDVLTLEKNVNELHQLIIDMTTLIELQDEMIDPIQYNIQNSQKVINDAIINLKIADKHAISVRKKKIALVGLVIGAIGATILIITAIGALCAAAMGLFA